MQEIIKTVLFILWTNFLPPLSAALLEDRFSTPLDLGKTFPDGKPILGPHKTIRGVIAAVSGGALVAPLLGLAWHEAGIAAALAVAGDLLTSFGKRRFRFVSGKTLPVLDQALECLLPLLFLAPKLHLAPWQQLGVPLVFIPISYMGSRFWNYLLYRPPLRDRTKIIRSTTRLREWRACHLPMVRWQALLNFEYFIFYQIILTYFFKATGLYERGMRNAALIDLNEETFIFPNLPPAFDGYRILLLTDLHLDGHPEITDAIIKIIDGLEVDLCLIGGDIRMKLYGPIAPAIRQLNRLIPRIRCRHPILGVLGNHDCIEMVPDLEEAGIIMLVNDSWYIEEQGERLWIAGVDDPHFYKVHDLEAAFEHVPANAFRILLVHSPELYHEAAFYRPDLYLCGHTHGGQICLPGMKTPLFTHCRAPRFTACRRWRYKGMHGYTSLGAGASGVPLRFFSRGELSLLTLKRGEDGNATECVLES